MQYNTVQQWGRDLDCTSMYDDTKIYKKYKYKYNYKITRF